MRDVDTNAELAPILESITDAFFALDLRWRFTYVNSEAERILQRPRGELLGRSAWDKFPEAVGSTFYTEYHRAVEGQVTVEFEEYYPPLETWFEVKAYPSGTGLTVYFRDIGRRKRAEEELRRSEERLRGILVQYSSDIITILGADGTIRYESPASERVLGYEPEDLVGTNAFDRIHQEDLEQAAESFARILAGPGQGQPVETRFKHADGSWRYFEVLANSLLDGPDVRGVVINSRDITERKEVERELRRSRASLYEAQRVASLGSWEYYPGEDRAEWSDQLYLTFGLPPRAVAPSYKRFLEYVYPEDRRFLHRLLQKSLGDEAPQNTDFRIVRADGEVRWVNAQYEIVYDGTGNPDRAIGTVLDITGRKEAEQALQASESRLAEAQRVAGLGSWEAEPARSGTSRLEQEMIWSDEMYRIFGYSSRQFVPTFKDLVAAIHPEDREYVRETIQKAVPNGETSLVVEHRILRPDGEVGFVQARMEMVYEQDGKLLRNFGTVLDITERKSLEEEQARLAAIVESSGDAIIGKTLEGVIVTWNPGAVKLYGYTAEEVRGRNISVLSPSEDRTNEISELLERVARGESVRSRETVRVTKSGRMPDVSLTVSPIRDLSGTVTGISTVERDISESKALEQQLEHQAVHDPLTGLPNRVLFADRLRHALSLTDRRQEHVAVFFIDLDNFKFVNDTLGHATGDQLLVEVSRRLEACLRPEDTIARFGGDEFTVLLEGARAEEAETVAERILEELQAPLALATEEISITASIGITFGVSSLETSESVLRSADLAMYGAKADGKDGYETFRPIMRARAENRLRLENDLRRAVQREEFVVFYQPKVQLASGRISGVEALVRWDHPERGLVPPLDFIPLAEENGMIVSIGLQVLRKALHQAKVWQERYPGDPPLLMCVNLSARQFQHPEMVQDIVGIIRDTGVDPNCLDLEITESLVMKYGESNLSRLRELRDMGIKIAIDDFGTGYSSLAHLQRLPADYLKIDRSFIDGLKASPENKVLVSTITYLAHSLGLSVVAEGVETIAQLAQVRELGCDMAQGYYFAEPQPAMEIDALLKKAPRW